MRQVFLQSMGDFAAFNKLYEEFFAPHKPARSCVEVAALPKGVAVEMEYVLPPICALLPSTDLAGSSHSKSDLNNPA